MGTMLNFSQWTGSTRSNKDTKSASLNENVKAAKSFLIKRYAEKHKIEEITPEVEQKAVNNKSYDRIREILKGNDGYVYAFVKFHFDHGATLTDLSELYQKIKDNSGSLNSLPMTIEEYSKQETVNGVNPFEALMDQFHNIEQRRKQKWIIEKVNGDLRRSIKQLPPEDIDRLYKAAKVIDDADEDAGDFEDPDTGHKTNNRLSLLKKSNAFSDAKKYLVWVEEMAEGVSNSDLTSKINALRTLQPEAGIIYSRGGYLVMSIRTENAQKELCSVANWCINRGLWGSYGGKSNYLQYNIFNFNLPVTHPYHITGTTVDSNGRVYASHDKNDASIVKSSEPSQHFSSLGYSDDLTRSIISSIPMETTIKQIVTGLGINTSEPFDLLASLVKSTYKIDLDVEEEIRNVVIGILRDQLSKKLSKEKIIDLYMKFGVLSTFSARMINILIPDLNDEERRKILDNNDRLMNDPGRGLKAILARTGRSAYPQVTRAVDSEDQIKQIISSGESLT
jgi:hypothetical protein